MKFITICLLLVVAVNYSFQQVKFLSDFVGDELKWTKLKRQQLLGSSLDGY